LINSSQNNNSLIDVIQSLADSKFSKMMGYPKLDTPISVEFSNTILRLPLWFGMGTVTVSKILSALDKIRPNIKLN
jgi:dTDP-4-amino-4,6-dideoxygalactose transaminase